MLENESHDRRPKSSLTDANIRAVRELIEGDRRLTVDNMHWETLAHPPYSPDVSPCDYFLFATMKESLGEERFEKMMKIRTMCAIG